MGPIDHYGGGGTVGARDRAKYTKRLYNPLKYCIMVLTLQHRNAYLEVISWHHVNK